MESSVESSIYESSTREALRSRLYVGKLCKTFNVGRL
jgi:hypothetical protein